MNFVLMAAIGTAVLIAFVYFGSRRFTPKQVKNIGGGLGVFVGLAWHGAMGLGGDSFVFKVGFIFAGYFLALGLMRAMGAQE